MALRAAVANGNWSSTATWNGGVLPNPGDIVASNNFTVTIDVNVNVDSITNAAQSPTTSVPVMTSNTAPSGIVDASINLDPAGTFAAYKVFDNNISTEWTGGNGNWVSYQFTTPKAINQYNFISASGKYTWSFQAWDGSSWVTLHSISAAFFTNYTSPLIGNSTLYIKYRILFADGAGGGASRVQTIQFYEFGSTSPAVAGGGFILNDGVTVTCTNTGDGISMTNCVTCLTYSGTTSATVNANIRGRDGCGVFCVHKTGTGTLNINGYLAGRISSNGNGGALAIQNTGVINIVGNIIEPTNAGQTILISSTCTLNIIGNITGGNFNGEQTIRVNAVNTIINVTGNIIIGSGGATGWTTFVIGVNAGNVQITLVGDIDGTFGNSSSKFGLGLGTNSIVTHTGNIIGTTDNVSGGVCVSSGAVHYYDQVGYIKASMNAAGFASTNGGAINLFTGPFISSPSGIQPFIVVRMHYRRTIGSYYEFRNNSTNGALPPAAPAPATRLVSPDTVADSPIPANVRQGTVYSLGSQTGTMIVPSPSNVANNVPVDNTVGTAVLDPNAIWAVPLTSINTLNSIGRRVKNAATVETTGAQIQTTLNNNE
jgi:hypothetical protein